MLMSTTGTEYKGVHTGHGILTNIFTVLVHRVLQQYTDIWVWWLASVSLAMEALVENVHGFAQGLYCLHHTFRALDGDES